MILCSCNALREDDVRAAARCGARCADTAYEFLGCQFQCGCCREDADALVAAERRAARPARRRPRLRLVA